MEILATRPVVAAKFAGWVWFVAAAFTSFAALGAPSPSEDAVKAAYLYRFTQYIEWPETPAADIPFSVAIMDAPGVASELRRVLSNRTIKETPAQVREISRVQELGNAAMLYIGSAQIDRVRDAIAAAAAQPVLIVTDAENGLATGSVLNFVMLDHRVRFEVSLPAAERSRLRISAELLGVAARVEASEHHSGIAKAPLDAAGEY